MYCRLHEAEKRGVIQSASTDGERAGVANVLTDYFSDVDETYLRDEILLPAGSLMREEGAGYHQAFKSVLDGLGIGPTDYGDAAGWSS